MPCRDFQDDNYDYEQNQQRKLDDLTRMLCGLCQESTNKQILRVKGLATWRAKHQAADKKRINRETAQKRREQMRRKALKKLTTGERRLLGLLRDSDDKYEEG